MIIPYIKVSRPSKRQYLEKGNVEYENRMAIPIKGIIINPLLKDRMAEISIEMLLRDSGYEIKKIDEKKEGVYIKYTNSITRW